MRPDDLGDLLGHGPTTRLRRPPAARSAAARQHRRRSARPGDRPARPSSHDQPSPTRSAHVHSDPPSAARVRAASGSSPCVAIGGDRPRGCAVRAARHARSTSRTLNDSGVSGTVTFSAVGDGRASRYGRAGRQPGHACPHPSRDVRQAHAAAEVPARERAQWRVDHRRAAPIDQLFAGNLAVNIHKSNDDLKTYTACVDIR